jgi:hypothetical protein
MRRVAGPRPPRTDSELRRRASRSLGPRRGPEPRQPLTPPDDRSESFSRNSTARHCRPHQRRPTLRANQHRLDTLVEALLRNETLDAADAYRAAGVPYPVEPDLPAQAPDVVRR